MDNRFDILIIGGGPAGISAALTAINRGKTVGVITNPPESSKLYLAESVTNYPGISGSGKDIVNAMFSQLEHSGAQVIYGRALSVMPIGKTVGVAVGNDFYEAGAVIVAAGISRKPVCQGETEFLGRGVSYCAVCDAFFYRGKKVAVIGNGDFALKEAEEIGNVASEVTILTNGLPEAFSRKPEYPVRTEKIQNLKGTDFLEGVELADGTGLEVSGVFVAIGTAGSTEIARRMGAELTEKGNIRVDEEMRTTIPGLYAAGDCTGGLLQVAKAVYEGAVAGMDASRYTRPEKAPELAAAEATGKSQE